MSARQIPEPPPPPTPDEIAERRALAEAIHEASVTLRRALDLARLVGGKPDGYTLDQMTHVADTLGGWSVRTALGAGAIDLVNEWTPPYYRR
jgi:hypothetical protein